MRRAIVSLLVLIVGVSSCLDGAEFAAGDCVPFVYGHRDSNGNLDPCCTDKTSPCPGDTPPPTEPPCAGTSTCMSIGPAPDWSMVPVLMLHGPSSVVGAAMCPQEAMSFSTLGRDPLLPNACPLCQCGQPSCILPDGLIADESASCGMGVSHNFPYDPNVSCNNPTTFDPKKVQSFALTHPTVSKCAPSMIPSPKDVVDPQQWKTMALVCRGLGGGACSDPHNQVCVPSAPSGFTQCLQRSTQGQTNADCPSAYPNKHVYYETIDWATSCTACDCSPPVGSACKAEVKAFTDMACTDAGLLVDALVSLTPGPACFALQPGATLQGMTEEWVMNAPGSCDPIESKPTGTVKALESSAWEFCCADPDAPDL